MSDDTLYALNGILLIAGMALCVVNVASLLKYHYTVSAYLYLGGVIFCAIGSTWTQIHDTEAWTTAGFTMFLLATARVAFAQLTMNVVIGTVAFIICMYANHFRMEYGT